MSTTRMLVMKPKMVEDLSSSSGDNCKVIDKDEELFFRENQENESPRRKLAKSAKHSTLKPRHEKSEKYPDASRLLRSKVNEEDDESYNYNPDDDVNRLVIRTIMVGSEYQAQVPDGICHYDDALPYENEDKLIWDPSIMHENEVAEYLGKSLLGSSPAAIPSGSHLRDSEQALYFNVFPVIQKCHLRDNEQALYLLLQCGHNVEEALRRLKMNAVSYNETMSPWSEEECRNFEAGVREFGKNFYLTQKNKVRTRSVGELVQFYYLWKKSERHDIFANKVRLEKKKYALHPGVTDFMDRFLEDQDMRESSSSPSIQGVVEDKKCEKT